MDSLFFQGPDRTGLDWNITDKKNWTGPDRLDLTDWTGQNMIFSRTGRTGLDWTGPERPGMYVGLCLCRVIRMAAWRIWSFWDIR